MMEVTSERSNSPTKWDRRKESVRKVLHQHPKGLTSSVIAEKVRNGAWDPHATTITLVCKRLGCLWQKNSPNAPTTWRLPRASDGDVKIRYVSVMPGWSGGLLDSEEVELLTTYFMNRSISYERKKKFVDQVVGLFALAVPDEIIRDVPGIVQAENCEGTSTRTIWQGVREIVNERIADLSIGNYITTSYIATIVQREFPDASRKRVLIEVRTAIDDIKNCSFLEFSSGGRTGTRIKRVRRGVVML